MKFHILPGVGEYENGISYYFPYYDELDTFISYAFYNRPSTNELVNQLKEEGSIVDYTVSIEILNGCGVPGAAKRQKMVLEENNYKVASIGDYHSMNIQQTKIVTSELKYATQFLTYYPDAIIEVGTNMMHDIQIIIGKQ